MNLALDHWHIEPSGICTRKCPRCPRAELPYYSINKNLSLEFYPCCWVANDYDHNKLWSSFGKENFNLHKNTFTDIMSNNFWDNEFKLFNGIECASKCTKPKLLDKHHTTEW